MVRIGIICTPSLSDEVWKNEIIEVNTEKRPWLANLPIELTIKKDDIRYTSDDISVAYYVKDKMQTKGSVTLISLLEENAKEKLLSNDINFLLIYDLLEAFHTLPQEDFEQCKKLLQLPNIYPPYSYQSFVNHKNVYYEYLRTKGIPVLPFVYISEDEFTNDKKGALKRIMSMPSGDEGRIIGKPIYGQDSKDVYEFYPPIREERVIAYLERTFNNYDGCIFQPFVNGFNTNGEYKIYFVGDELVYGVHLLHGERRVLRPDEEPDVMNFAKSAFAVLPPLIYKGYKCPRFLTRIDISCCYGPSKYFISEVEFVPSLFMDEDDVSNLYMDAKLGDQIIKIANTIKAKVKQSTDVVTSYQVYVLFVFFIILMTALFFVGKRVYQKK